MRLKPKINNIIIYNILKYIILLVVTLLLTLSINPIQAHADEYDTWAQSIVDSTGASTSGGTDDIQHGVSYKRTGYLCYLLDKNGNAVPGTNAVALSSPGFSYYTGKSNTQWKVTSRKGGYVAGDFNGEAPWEVTPWDPPAYKGAPCITNEPDIKAYFEKVGTDNVQNSAKFVSDNWDKNKDKGIIDKFGQGEYFLVIETLMHFQYSVADNSILRDGDEVYNSLLYRIWNAHISVLMSDAPETLQKAYSKGDIGETKMRGELAKALQKLYNTKGPSHFEKRATGRSFVGVPVVGTVPNLIDYKGVIGTNTDVFDSYINKVAPFAERINSGDIGEKVGFIAWTGSTSYKISNDQVLGPNNSAGLAMIVISATEKQDDIDTYSPPEGSPGNAEDPSTNPNKQGKVTIIKGYYTEDTKTGTKTSDGVYTRKDVTNIVNIMDEPNDYKLVQWDIAETVQAVDPTNWNPLSNQTGTTPQTVELKETDKVVYVLLKKTDETPKEEEQAEGDWILTESRLTRIAKTTNTDTNKDLLSTHKFTVTYPSLSTTHSNCYYYCPEGGYHSWTDPETDETHGYSCDGCVGVDEDRSLADTDIEIYWKNELKETYKDLMSHKNDEVWGEKWNKHFKGDRTSRDAQTDELTGVTYEFLIHRAGKDNTMIYNGKSGLTGNNNQVENNLLDLGFVSGKVNQFL